LAISLVSHELSPYTMNKHIRKATQSITVLKPRFSWIRCRIGALSALSSLGSAN